MANIPFQYRIFKPYQSKKAVELMNMSNDELARRYLKKKTSASPKFKSAFLDEVNFVNDEDILKHGRMYSIVGSNLNHIYTALSKRATKLNDMGYEFRMSNVVDDLEALLSYDDREVDKMNYDTAPLSVYTTEIAYFFAVEILTEKALSYAENLSRRGYTI